jgi:inner membrane protein
MMARSHIVVALASWFVGAPLLHLSPFNPVSIACAVVGSLLPDVDHPKSWVGRRTRPISTFLAAIFGHRGITHSALAIATLAVGVLYAGYRHVWVCALVTGYLSHLFADMLTPRGLRLAWPLRGTWSLPVYRTGSPGENIVVALILVGMLTWEVQRLLPGVRFLH